MSRNLFRGVSADRFEVAKRAEDDVEHGHRGHPGVCVGAELTGRYTVGDRGFDAVPDGSSLAHDLVEPWE